MAGGKPKASNRQRVGQAGDQVSPPSSSHVTESG